MSDAKQTVENIRAFLGSDSSRGSAELVALAADYAEMCREANFRLRRCADFLREGLLGEAIDYASAKPPLLDLVAALEFRELSDWDRSCGSLGLARPGRLAMESARELKEAAAKHEPLRELMGKHRYLALSRAPLPERLAVLRDLIRTNPAIPCWRREAEELERARAAELRNEAAVAMKAADLPTVQKLLAELNAGPWQSPAPAELKDSLAKSAATLRQASAIEQLRSLAPTVRAAFAAMSYDECKLVFTQWGKIVKEAKLPVPADLRQEILPLAHWLDEQDDRRERHQEFRLACDALAAAIDAHAPAEQLTRQYREAMAFEAEIPADLSSAYRRAMEADRREQQIEKRKQYALAAVLVGAIAAALAALVWVMVSGKH